MTDWPEFDRDIFGGNYTGHHGHGPKVTLTSPAASRVHPILMGVDLSKLKGTGSLYKTTPLAKGATELIRGKTKDAKPEAVAWTHNPKSGNRVFYTSLGHVGEFPQPPMNVLLKNALCWAAKIPMPQGKR
jgi:type 1 glutamine amidotransferase